MADETIETLQQKLKIYQQLFETLAPSAPLNILTSQSTNTLTPLTLSSLTPSPPLDPAVEVRSESGQTGYPVIHPKNDRIWIDPFVLPV